jgi:hypothetical protein
MLNEENKMHQIDDLMLQVSCQIDYFAIRLKKSHEIRLGLQKMVCNFKYAHKRRSPLQRQGCCVAS